MADECPEMDKDTEEVLQEVLRVYGKYDAKYLENLTHQEKPWIETRGNLPVEARCDNAINLKLIKNFYDEMYDEDA